MSGVSNQSTISGGSPADVAAEARRAIEETQGRRFLLAPDCSIDPQTPEANLRALVETARS